MERGRAEGRQCAFSPAGTCHVSMCLTPESGDVSKTANTYKHTHTDTHAHTAMSPPQLHSQWRLGNKQHDETQHHLCCSVSWQLEEQPKSMHTHNTKNTHMQTLTLPDHIFYRQTNHYSQRSEETYSLFCSVAKNKLKNEAGQSFRTTLLRDATRYDLHRQVRRLQIFGVWTCQDLISVYFLVKTTGDRHKGFQCLSLIFNVVLEVLLLL